MNFIANSATLLNQTHTQTQTPAALAKAAPDCVEAVPPILTELRAGDPEFQRLVHITRRKARSVIATPKDLSTKMYVLMEGSVNVICVSEKRKRLVISSLGPGSIFGHGALTSEAGPQLSVEAVEDVTLWVIPAAKARAALERYPIITWGLLQTYGQRLAQVEENLEDMAYRKLPERLAGLLLDLADQMTGLLEGYSHQTLADYMGTYRETVSAVLRDFRRQGLITISYRRILIKDREGLADIAGVWEF
jgi:CRP/FNR family transcriptional regulator, cyclic AMP receptor protein